MAASKASQAQLTSWAGTHIDVSKLAVESMTLTESVDVFESTPLGQAYQNKTLGLGSATASINARWPATPAVGNAGQIVFTGGDYYNDAAGDDAVIGIVSYTLNMNWPSLESTSTEDATNSWKSFTPGDLEWNGTIELRLDDTEELVVSQLAGATALAAVFTLTSSHTFTGNIFINGQTQGAGLGQLNTQTFNFNGTGTLTAAGTDNFIAAGAVPDGDDLAAGSLAGLFASGRTFSGNAFPTSVALTVPRSGLITVGVNAQFTGAITKDA